MQTIGIISIDAINNNSVSFQPIHFSFQAKIMIFITALRAHLVPTYLCNSLSLILFLSPTLLCLTHTHIYLPRYLHTPGYKLYPYLSHTTCVRLPLKHTHTHTIVLSLSARLNVQSPKRTKLEELFLWKEQCRPSLARFN